MPDNDDRSPDSKSPSVDNKSPGNVIPFGRLVSRAIADELHRYYGALVAEPLPEDLAALAEALAAKLAREKEEA